MVVELKALEPNISELSFFFCVPSSRTINSSAALSQDWVISAKESKSKLKLPEPVTVPLNPVLVPTEVTVPAFVVYPELLVHCDIFPPLLVKVCELLAVVVPVLVV